MREWVGEPSRTKFGARVLWDSGTANTYRWGAENSWDLQVRTLPVLDSGDLCQCAVVIVVIHLPCDSHADPLIEYVAPETPRRC